MGYSSRIRIFPIPDPGVKKASDPGSGSAVLRTGMNWSGTHRSLLPLKSTTNYSALKARCEVPGCVSVCFYDLAFIGKLYTECIYIITTVYSFKK